MSKLHRLLAEYGESHKNETNKAIHWICVPAIFFSIVGLLYGIKLPFQIGNYPLNAAVLVMLLVIIYYAGLSKTLWFGMLIFCIICLLLSHLIEIADILPLWVFCSLIFVLAWIAQFYGHKVEGKKPSFLKDLQFLLVGPAWLMSFVYKKMGIGI